MHRMVIPRRRGKAAPLQETCLRSRTETVQGRGKLDGVTPGHYFCPNTGLP